jgi:hypothetical protein
VSETGDRETSAELWPRTLTPEVVRTSASALTNDRDRHTRSDRRLKGGRYDYEGDPQNYDH